MKMRKFTSHIIDNKIEHSMTNRSYLLSLAYGKNSKYYNKELTRRIDSGIGISVSQWIEKIEREIRSKNYNIPLYSDAFYYTVQSIDANEIRITQF